MSRMKDSKADQKDLDFRKRVERLGKRTVELARGIQAYTNRAGEFPEEPSALKGDSKRSDQFARDLNRCEAALERLEKLLGALNQQWRADEPVDYSLIRALIISSSRKHGSGFLDYAEEEIRNLLGADIGTVTFVPWALANHDEYTATVRDRLREMGYQVRSLHETDDPGDYVETAEAVFIGGGNTHRLLDKLYETEVVASIRDRVRSGMPYMGSSAGSNVAHNTIMTTNDMPIVDPPLLDALKILPFALNPHYLDPDPGSTHKGETREERILQFLEEHDQPVVGIREGMMIRVRDGHLTLVGTGGARLFIRGEEPREIPSGERLDFLLG